MESFNDLQELWRSNQDHTSLNLEDVRRKAEDKIRSQQKQLILTNFGLTITFILVIGVLVWIYTSFPDRSLFFKLSLGCMGLLLVSYLGGMWSGLLYRNINPIQKPERYIDYASKKISIRLFMLESGVPLYYILLSLAMGFYMVDVLKGIDTWVIMIISVGIIAYIFGIWMLFKGKRRVQIRKYRETLTELKEWRGSL